MRVWDIDPRRLCHQHLLGEHREIHAVFAVISRGTRGYARHPETMRWRGHLAALGRRHGRVVREMRRRGYVHRTPVPRSRGPAVAPARLLSLHDQVARLRATRCGCVSRLGPSDVSARA